MGQRPEACHVQDGQVCRVSVRADTQNWQKHSVSHALDPNGRSGCQALRFASAEFSGAEPIMHEISYHSSDIYVVFPMVLNGI